MPHHPSSAPGSSKKKCSCGRAQCNAPQMYRRLLEVDDERALLETEVRLLQRRIQFLDQIKADREYHFAQWQSQEQEYEAKMYHAWSLAPQRRWYTHRVDLRAIQRREVIDWYHRECGEISRLLHAKEQTLHDTEKALYQQQQRISRLDVKAACSASISTMACEHLLGLKERQDRSQNHLRSLKRQQQELNRTYAHSQRLQQRPPLPHQEGKKAVDIRWWVYALFGVGRPMSRSAQVSLIDQEELTARYQQACEEHFGFLWYSQRYWQLGEDFLIEGLLPILAQRYQLAQTFIQSHLARARKPHP